MPASYIDDAASFTVRGKDAPQEPSFDEKTLGTAFEYESTLNQHEQTDEIDMPSSKVPYRPSAENTPRNVDRSRENGYTGKSYNLPPLQAQSNLDEDDNLDPIADDDPSSYDLVVPGDASAAKDEYSLEKRSQSLFSKEHLQVIFSDSSSLLSFTSFLGIYNPRDVPILVHYLDTLKALRAIHYANAILQGLERVEEVEFTKQTVSATKNQDLEARAAAAFDYLVKEVLPAYITSQYINVVSASISERVTGMLAPHLQEASEGLAEVFCLTDPSRQDNPIVFASEEFNRTTQYGMNYIVGRNCRFLQGPFTNPLSVNRIRDSVLAGRQHQEVLLNYRRDGSPFMNLLMTAPLCDSRGRVRYYIGAQVDVSGLVKDCAELESFERLLEMQRRGEKVQDPQVPSKEKDDELAELAEMLNQGELNTIRQFGGKLHKEGLEEDRESIGSGRHRLLLKDPSITTPPMKDISGKLSGVYQHYLLIRPYPALRVLFASPSQRVPGILQSPFMNKIGGSNRVREELTAAFADGRGVTAKVRWINKGDEEGRNKWLHCTPLIGSNGRIGVWMVVIVDDEKQSRKYGGGRPAPPVNSTDRPYTPSHRPIIGGNGYSGENHSRTASGNGSVNSFRMN